MVSSLFFTVMAPKCKYKYHSFSRKSFSYQTHPSLVDDWVLENGVLISTSEISLCSVDHYFGS